MEEKLRRLMKHEGINSTRLAEILGIQASGISHIMSGRNKPSYDFLLKLLQRFPQISPDWLLLDKGPMYRDEVKKQSTTSIGRSAIDAGSTYGGAVNAPMNASANLKRPNTCPGRIKTVRSSYGFPRPLAKEYAWSCARPTRR